MTERVNYRFKEAKKKPTQANVVCEVPSKLAMRLALAYYVERCIEDGTLESYADAARRLGITRARMTQVMDLMLVPCDSIEMALMRKRTQMIVL